MLYQTSYVIFCFHVNTIVYLEAIENPVEYQNLLWIVWETRPEYQRNLFMTLFVKAFRIPLGYVVVWTGYESFKKGF